MNQTNSTFESMLKAAISRESTGTADTMLINAHLSQMKMFGIRQGVEFYPEQDNFGSQRYDFIKQVIKFNQLDARLDSIWDHFLALGKGLFYIRPTEKTYRLYWFDKDSYMESASMHKSVMALLYGIAIEQGHIPSVDEPASTYLTEWQDDARSKITIRNMLQMAHGLSRASGGFSPLGDNMKLGMGTNWGGIALKAMAEDPPGAVFAYSNLNSQLLGLILQRATGVQYAEFLQKNLWSKVGESSARVWLDRPGGLAKTSGSLFTPPRNWLRLGLLHLNKGRVGDEQVVPEAWIDQVITPSPNNPNYGLQTWLGTEYRPKVDYGKGVAAHVPHSEPFEASDVVYFDGANGQRVYVIASEALVIVRMGKGGLDFKTGAFLWDEPKLPNLVLRGLRSAATEAEQP